MRPLHWLGCVALVGMVGMGCAEDTRFPVSVDPDATETLLSPRAHANADLPHARNFVAPMDWREEVPAVVEPTNATGLARFQLSRGGDELDFQLIVANIHNVTMAHIHIGERGETGPPVVWLFPAGPPPELIEGRSSGVLVTGTITGADLVGPLEGEGLGALLDLIHDDRAYVNVHTEQNPPGEIRGQIRVAGVPR
jgi:hypothetical protein